MILSLVLPGPYAVLNWATRAVNCEGGPPKSADIWAVA